MNVKQRNNKKERYEYLRELIATVGVDNIIQVDVAKKFNVSPVTINRDLKEVLKDIDDKERKELDKVIYILRNRFMKVQEEVYKRVFYKNDNTCLNASRTWLSSANNFLENLEKLGFYDAQQENLINNPHDEGVLKESILWLADKQGVGVFEYINMLFPDEKIPYQWVKNYFNEDTEDISKDDVQTTIKHEKPSTNDNSLKIEDKDVDEEVEEYVLVEEE